MSVEVITFGCRLNTYESELIKQSANQAGLENTLIFNSCAVTSEAERQLRQAIRKARKEHPHHKIIVTGCAAQIDPAKYDAMPEVDVVMGNKEKTSKDAYLIHSERVIVNDIMSVQETASHLVDTFEGKTRAFLQVQNGCNHRCTFCIIPYGRGNSRSVPLSDIVTQTTKMVEAGYNEVVLTGVDITSYGSDLPGSPTLGQTIKRLLHLVPNLQRLRLSSIDVAEIDVDLFDLLINEPRMMPYLHLSLQAGDDMILKRMKRRHNRQQVLDFCANVRSKRSEVTFGADIIAGFPTEDETMFQNTLNIVQEAGLTWLHVFPYSERSGTPAARMPQVAKALRKERARLLRIEGSMMIRQHYNKLLNKRVNALIENDNNARAEDFSLIHFHGEATPGTVRQILITDLIDDKLIGTVL